METSSSPQQDPIMPIETESLRLLKSQPPRFLALFFLFTFPPSVATILCLIFLFSPLLETHYSVYYHRQGRDHDHIATPSLTAAILVTTSCFLFHLVCSSCAIGSVTYSVFHASHRRQLGLKSLLTSVATSFLPIMSTAFPLQAITIAMFSLTGFSVVACLGMLVGFSNLDLGSPPYIPMIMTWVLTSATHIAARVLANWSLATAIAALEPKKYGFECFKLSKSLINDDEREKEKRSKIGFKISFLYGISQGSMAIITCFLCLILIGVHRFIFDEYRTLVLLIGGVVLMHSMLMSWFRIQLIAANAVFYVHCKGSSTEVDQLMMTKKYVKLTSDDDDHESIVCSLV